MLPNSERYSQVITPDYVDTYRKEYKELRYTTPAVYRYISRYAYTDRIYDRNNIEYHETYEQRNIPERQDDRYYKVDNTTVNRLDIISYKFYGFSVYWWVIAMANNIIDPFNIPLDTVLRIPPMSSLYVDGGVLSNV